MGERREVIFRLISTSLRVAEELERQAVNQRDAAQRLLALLPPTDEVKR